MRGRAGQGKGRGGHCGVPSMESTLAKAHDPRPDRDMRLMSCLVWATQISSGGLRGNWWDSNIAEFRDWQTGSLWRGSSCHPTGLFQGSLYASRLNASCRIFLLFSFLPRSRRRT